MFDLGSSDNSIVYVGIDTLYKKWLFSVSLSLCYHGNKVRLNLPPNSTRSEACSRISAELETHLLEGQSIVIRGRLIALLTEKVDGCSLPSL